MLFKRMTFVPLASHKALYDATGCEKLGQSFSQMRCMLSHERKCAAVVCKCYYIFDYDKLRPVGALASI